MFELVQQQPSRPQRVVVMGAGGFVGASVVRQLRAEGIDVSPLTRREVDLLSDGAAQGLADRLKPSDCLVFISAVAPARTAAQLADNVAMARSACEALGRVKVAHLVYLSSDAVYADDASLVTEASCLRPAGLHGAMHVAREAMMASTQVPLCILRPTAIYGASDPHNSYGPNRFRRQAAAAQDIVLFGGGEEMRDHIAIDDVAALLSLCIQHRAKGILNAATGESASFRQVAELVAAASGQPARIVETPRQAPITHRHFDTARLVAAFPRFAFTRLSGGLAAAGAAAKGSPSS